MLNRMENRGNLTEAFTTALHCVCPCSYRFAGSKSSDLLFGLIKDNHLVWETGINTQLELYYIAMMQSCKSFSIKNITDISAWLTACFHFTISSRLTMQNRAEYEPSLSLFLFFKETVKCLGLNIR